MVSAYYVHSGLSRKADLFGVIREYLKATSKAKDNDAINCLRKSILDFEIYCVDSPEELLGRLKRRSDLGTRRWVLKANSSNNATGVYMLDNCQKAIDATMREMLMKESGEVGHRKGTSTWLLQRHVDDPLLLQNRKFHFRANVLAIGNFVLYFHQDVVAHVATKTYDPRSVSTDRAAHITNHCTQKTCADYDNKKNTLLLTDVEALLAKEIGSASASSMCRRMYDQMMTVTKQVFVAFESRRDKKLFLPMPNSFELFGLDFLADRSGQVFLLEINTGPGLEGYCMPALSRRIVDETLSLVLRDVTRADETDAAETSRATSRFHKLMDRPFRARGKESEAEAEGKTKHGHTSRRISSALRSRISKLVRAPCEGEHTDIRK
eukprot:g2631.t1